VIDKNNRSPAEMRGFFVGGMNQEISYIDNLIMTIRKSVHIISILLLLYLLADSFLHIEFAVTKNNHFTAFQKEEIDSTQNIDTVKQKAKGFLDTIHFVHRIQSDKSVTQFWLLAVLIVIQIFLFLSKPKKILRE
jgi:hypothetical protein